MQPSPQPRAFFVRILAILAIYLFISLSQRITGKSTHHGATIIEKIKNQNEGFQLQELSSVFEFDEVYTGIWQCSQNCEHFGLTEQQGQMEMRIKRITGTKSQKMGLRLTLANGQYIDEGVLDLNLVLDSKMFKSIRPSEDSISLGFAQNSTMDAIYVYTKLLMIEQQGPVEVGELNLSFTNTAPSILKQKISFSLQGSIFEVEILEHDQNLFRQMLFAVVMFFASYVPFIAALDLLKQFFEQRENPLHYSLGTVLMATMCDTVMCFLAFEMAFRDQQSLVLFILPAFMLCILFTNIEPKLMYLIFESNHMQARFCGCCGLFNTISYGSLLVIYPLMIVTNLNRVLFLLLSCILLPQIYLNAVRSTRPELSSDFYLKFVLPRFALILYLRCFPFNVFCLKPDYTLGILCCAFIVGQFGLLYLQKKYGPKIVVPKWMLEPAYDYGYEEASNLEEGDNDCSICLISLSKTALDEEEGENKVMKTPCKHLYHSSCLINWMKIKMECPQCRSPLPPYQ